MAYDSTEYLLIWLRNNMHIRWRVDAGRGAPHLYAAPLFAPFVWR